MMEGAPMAMAGLGLEIRHPLSGPQRSDKGGCVCAYLAAPR